MKHKSAVGLIKLANQMSRDTIYMGQRLKIPSGPVHLLVDRSQYRLMVFAAGLYVKEYRVGLGKHALTPIGHFTIKTRLINPMWYKPGAPKPIPHGDPENILGTRWLGFKERPTIGIHGVRPSENDSIGKDLSAGCVRMVNEDVEDLFGLVPLGSTVEIRQ
jgi:lipoprotein-anchoring transpeptidase ErfK/SrfK